MQTTLIPHSHHNLSNYTIQEYLTPLLRQLDPSFSKLFGTHTFYQGGDPCYLKNRCPINVKFCRVLEPSSNVLEMLKMLA